MSTSIEPSPTPRAEPAMHGLATRAMSSPPAPSSAPPEHASGPDTSSTRQPDMDVYESGTDRLLLLDVPGVIDDTLSLSVAHDTLTVAAKAEHDGALVEFRREVSLPRGIDLDQIDASLRCGVLRVRVPLARCHHTLTVTDAAELSGDPYGSDEPVDWSDPETIDAITWIAHLRELGSEPPQPGPAIEASPAPAQGQ